MRKETFCDGALNTALHCDTSILHDRDVAGVLVERAEALTAVLSLVADDSHHIERAAAIIIEALARSPCSRLRQWWQCGRGTASRGQLVGRFRREREPWPVRR